MTQSKTILRSAAVSLALAPMLSLGAIAATPQSALPPGVYVAGSDYRDATAGTYDLDASHTAVIARVSHIGYSYSAFRFDTVEGTMRWDPANPAASSLSISVETASIATPVKGFAAELAGDGYLKSKAFPKATFVSTAFRRIDDKHGEVDGRLTLMGKTAPATFKVTLVGAGKGFGSPRIGVEARTWIKPQNYRLPVVFADPIEIVVDAEFAKAS